MTSDDIDEADDEFESDLITKCVKLGQLDPFTEPDGKTSFEYTPHGLMMMELLELGEKYFIDVEEGWEIFQELVSNTPAPNEET